MPEPANTPATPEFGEMSFEDALAKLAKPETEPDKLDPTAVEPPPVKTDPAPPEPAPSPDSDVRAVRIAAIMEEREKAAAEAAAYKAELEALRKEHAASKLEKDRFRRDPLGYLKSLDPELKRARLAEDLWMEELGDAAPAEYKARREASRAAALVEDVESRVDQRVEAKLAEFYNQQREQLYNQYVGAVQSYVTAAPDSLPLVKKYAAANASGVTQATIKIAEKAAAAGKMLTPAEAAAALEKELTTLRAVLGFSEAPSNPTPPAATTPPTDPATTIRNRDQQVIASKTDPDDDAHFWAAVEAARRVRAQLNPGG